MTSWSCGRQGGVLPTAPKLSNTQTLKLPRKHRSSMTFPGLPSLPRPFIAFHGLPWPTIALHGLPLPSISFHGLQWPSREVPATALGAQPCQVETLGRPAVQPGISARCHSLQSNVNALQSVELGCVVTSEGNMSTLLIDWPELLFFS